MLSQDDYVFFWKPESEHGWASQWYRSPFEATIELDGKEEDVTFLTAEHWMMAQKALLFGDDGVAREVLAEDKTDSGAMARVKALGRKVSNFDEEVWNAKRSEIVIAGNMHKFTQNPELRELLIATGNKRLVEASPRDRIWGVGFGAKNALGARERWGLNLLGLALEDRAMAPKPSYADRARNAIRTESAVKFGSIDAQNSPEPPTTPPPPHAPPKNHSLAIGIAPDDPVPPRIRSRKHTTPPTTRSQWQFGTAESLPTSHTVPALNTEPALDPRGSVSFAMPPPRTVPTQPTDPSDIPIVSSDPELQVKDFGYGFGDPSKPGYAPSISQEETLARQREWEQNKAKEREFLMSQDTAHDDSQQDQREDDVPPRPLPDNSSRPPRRGTGSFAGRGSFERGAGTGGGPFPVHRRGRGGGGPPQNGSARGVHRGFSRGGAPGPSSAPARPPGFGSTPPPHFQPLLPIPDSTTYYAPRQLAPPFVPPGFEQYSPIQPVQSAMPFLTPPVPVPVTPLHFPLDSIRYYLLGQLEYYLSPDNMLQDFFLRQQMDSRGWIPISLLASFNRVKNLTLDPQLVRDVLLISSVVQVRGNMVRMVSWESFVLPNARESTVSEDVSSSSTPAPPPLPPHQDLYPPPFQYPPPPLSASQSSQGPYPQPQDNQPLAPHPQAISQSQSQQPNQPPQAALYQPIPISDTRFLQRMQGPPPPHLQGVPPHPSQQVHGHHPHTLPPHMHPQLHPHLHPHQPQPYDVLSPPGEINGLNGAGMGHGHNLPGHALSNGNGQIGQDEDPEEEDDVVIVVGRDAGTAWSPERRG